MTTSAGRSPSRIADEDLAVAISKDRWATCVVIGSADSGKTTFARLLAQAMLESRPDQPIALVSTDPGQGLYGPPTTVGWGMAGRESSAGLETSDCRPAGMEPAGLAFVGSTSPYARLLDMLAAVMAVTRGAQEAASRVIVDTSGLASGPLGMALKRAKLDLIRPDLVLLLEKYPGSLSEMERWAALCAAKVMTASTPAVVRPRSAAARRKWRRQRYLDYFCQARVQSIPLGLPGASDVLRLPAGGLFAGRAGGAIIYGIARMCDPARLLAEAPWPLDRAKALVAGAVALDDSGRESSVRSRAPRSPSGSTRSGGRS